MSDGPVRIKGARDRAAICPFCREGARGLAILACPDCGTVFHRACAEEMGGCSTLGCRGAEIGRVRLRMRWRNEDHDGFLSRWDRPASERRAEPAARVEIRPRRISTLRLAWMALDGPRAAVGCVVGAVVGGALVAAGQRLQDSTGFTLLGVVCLLYFVLSGAYAANPPWLPGKRREWWE